jgi:hypothetical protein
MTNMVTNSMSDSTSSTEKTSSKSSDSKSKDSSSSDTPTTKSTLSDTAKSSSDSDKGSSDSDKGSSDSDKGKSAKESIGGKSDIHYGFFSSVRTPEYRSGWDDIWGSSGAEKSGGKSTKGRSNGKSKSGAKSASVELTFADLPDDVRDGLVEAARRKIKKSRSSYDKLDASGKVDWTISVTVNGGRA